MSGAARLLALDPGETTGWSMWVFSDTQPLTEEDHGMIPGGLIGFINWWRMRPDYLLPTEVVAESFVLDGRTAFPNVTPLRIEGALAALWNGLLTLQRNVFKRHAPDELLKELGYWWKGAGHDRDSARHAIAYCITRKHMPTLMKLYPPPPIAA